MNFFRHTVLLQLSKENFISRFLIQWFKNRRLGSKGHIVFAWHPRMLGRLWKLRTFVRPVGVFANCIINFHPYCQCSCSMKLVWWRCTFGEVCMATRNSFMSMGSMYGTYTYTCTYINNMEKEMKCEVNYLQGVDWNKYNNKDLSRWGHLVLTLLDVALTDKKRAITCHIMSSIYHFIKPFINTTTRVRQNPQGNNKNLNKKEIMCHNAFLFMCF